MTPIRIFAINALLVGAICISPAFSHPLYTLKSLCQKANENAETIKIAIEDQYIAQQDKTRARSVLFPRATLYGNYKNTHNEDSVSPDSTVYGAKLTQSFTLNGRELIAFDMAKKGIERADFSMEAVRSDYIFQVAQAYIQALSSKRLVEVADAEVERLTVYRNSVKEKLSVGNVTKTALYRAQAELSKARTNKIVAQNNLETAKASIINLTGIAEGFRISAEDIQDYEEFTTDKHEIQKKALANRFEIKAAKKAREIAKQTIDYEKGEYWPRLSLEGGYTKNDIKYPPNINYDDENLYVQAQLQFTLFDGGLRRAQVRQALSKERQAKLAVSSQEKAITLQSTQAFLEFETAKNTLLNLADELKSAQENYHAVQMQFKYGMADSINVMDANTLLVGAERRIANARYTYYLAILKIIYTQGEILSHLLSAP